MSEAAAYDTPYRGAWVDGVHHFALRVYFEDTDTAGIVYYANYLKFMERARSDMLRAAGIDQRAALDGGEGVYVVAEAHIRYFRSAKLDDDLNPQHGRAGPAASCVFTLFGVGARIWPRPGSRRFPRWPSEAHRAPVERSRV